MRLLATTALALALAAGAAAESLPEPGAYAVEVGLELPNVEGWRGRSTATLCLPHPGGALPVLSANNPLAACPAEAIRRDGSTLRFAIVCPGRNAARARAVFDLAPDGFAGRIAMTMGGKNMTMTEVQRGRRLGPCD